MLARSNVDRTSAGTPPRSRTSPRSGSRRLLLAEDDVAFRRLLQEWFQRHGYDVVAVGDGTELLERLGESSTDGEAFDAVVSDVRMPGWSGLNVLATMSCLDRRPPVVLITAFGDERVHEQAKHAGACAVLDKPFDIEELRVLVDSLVENGRRAGAVPP